MPAGLEHLLDDLNPAQREAVTLGEGPLLVLAGAGSGKTRVIAYRIAWLLGEQGVPTRNVLAVTFTNKAAGEMARRVDGLVLPLGLKSPLIAPSTCVRILRVHGEHIGLPKNFTIYDGIETAAFEQTPAPRTRAARPRPVPPRSLEKGLEVLVDHAVHHGVRGVARLVVPAVERHGGDIDPA